MLASRQFGIGAYSGITDDVELQIHQTNLLSTVLRTVFAAQQIVLVLEVLFVSGEINRQVALVTVMVFRLFHFVPFRIAFA